MEMPAPKKSRKKAQQPLPDAPRVKTREKTTAQMEEARRVEAVQNANATREQAEKLARVVAVEDEQHAADQTYSQTANHPIDPPRDAAGSAQQEDADDEGERKDSSEKSDEEDTFVPVGDSSEDEDEGDEGDDDSSDAPRGRRSKPAKSNRHDVISARSTKDSSGTPASSGKDAKKRKATKEKNKKSGAKKAKLGKVAGLAKQAMRTTSSASGRSSVIIDDFDAPMTQYGGPAVDDDVDEELERPVPAGKKKKGLPTTTIVKISAAPPKPLTKKEQRGNARKWTLEHLPRGTAAEFTTHVVPLARELLGTMEPWASLTVPQIQGIVNRVYKQGKVEGEEEPRPIVHEVSEDGAWWGLLGYRFTDWRSGFASQAAKAMEALIRTHEADDSDSESSEEEPAVPAGSDGQTAVSDAPAKPRPFKFDTPGGIADFVEWALQVHDGNGTSAFHWKQWGDGKEKKGFLLSYLIVYTYSHHLTVLDGIPDEYKRSSDPPYGALLLAAQAVERNLQFWKTGKYTVPTGLLGQFSFDNWGDIRTRESKTKTKLTRRATKFLHVLKKWDETRWEELREEATQWQERKKRTASSSRGTSEAEDMEETEEEEELVVMSD
ncbi:hypothetical protein B0H10DRAFT_2441025 [Mycena sp. CBHHK59/15]|nr:hypothetical protein B0H10DRAFT_2441025 [Mycena sp. CBHHK59/15]